MLFQLIDKLCNVAIDTLNYGPIEAARINTSFCPEAERSYKEVNAKVQAEINKTFDKIERDLAYQEEHPESIPVDGKTVDQISGEMIQGMTNFMVDWMDNLYKTDSVKEVNKNEIFEQHEEVLDEDEEEMIRKAMSEKGCW